jgi:hypothetical protein
MDGWRLNRLVGPQFHVWTPAEGPSAGDGTRIREQLGIIVFFFFAGSRMMMRRVVQKPTGSCLRDGGGWAINRNGQRIRAALNVVHGKEGRGVSIGTQADDGDSKIIC